MPCRSQLLTRSLKVCGDERCAPLPGGQWPQHPYLAGLHPEKELHQVVDWSRVDKEDYLLAMERSPIRDLEIKTLLRAALTDQINDREVYMKGIDASYHYEGYQVFKTETLAPD